MTITKTRTTIGTLVASVAFAAALVGPTAAQADSKTTTTPKKECKLGSPDPNGAQTYVPDGTIITKQRPDGSTNQLECKDGTWGRPARIAVGSTGGIVPVGALQGTPEVGTSPTYGTMTTSTQPLVVR